MLKPSTLPEPAVRSDERDALRAAVVLYAGTLSGDTLRVAAHQLAATLARQGPYARVAIGLRDAGGRTRLEAVSDLPDDRPQAELIQRLAGAIDEAIDQSATLTVPGTPDTSTILLEHEILRRAVGGCIATIPIGRGRADGQVLGAVLLQRGDAQRPFSRSELAALEDLLALASPVLALKQQAERRAWQRLADEWRDWRSALRGPQRRGLRLALAALGVALLLATLLPLEQRVGGRARIEGFEQRALAAPSAGFVKRVYVHPGDAVKAGAPLVDLAEADLQLEQERWASQRAQHQNAYAAAMARADRTQAAISLAKTDEANAQLALIATQLERSQLRAPFDAIVIAGDLSQSIGAPVREGDTLVTLARSDAFRVVVEIDEFDIAQVHAGQPGALALSALPWHTHAIVVERVTPLAKAVDGANVFEVQARLVAPTPELRPGLIGRGQLRVGRMPPLWAALRQPVDRLRLAWWSWGVGG